MSWIIALIALLIGIGLGMAIAYVSGLWRVNSTRQITAEIMRESEAHRQAELDSILGSVRSSFGDMSLEALKKANEELVTLGKSVLETERQAASGELRQSKSLIDQQLKEMTTKLEGVSTLMTSLEKDRELKFGELSEHLKQAQDQYTTLSESTSSLREALASSSARGQWGQRMAEDVLRMAGFVEKINYVKQKATAEGKIPDFTFFLPKDLTLNMDVKFPLDNYSRYVKADSDPDRERYCKAFIKDVKDRVREIRGREYINPAAGTVDYVLLFIPNEQIYAFIHEKDDSVLDDAIAQKVVFCSPVTLFAVLAVIRQAVDNFALEKTSNEILKLIGQFKKQWDSYQTSISGLGRRLELVNKAYDDVTGVRMRELEKPLVKMEGLREQRGLPASDETETIEEDAEDADVLGLDDPENLIQDPPAINEETEESLGAMSERV